MTAAWRSVFTYNKFAQITARAVRNSLKEEQRVLAEKRGQTSVRYQQWQNGKGGPQFWCNPTGFSLATSIHPSNSPIHTRTHIRICGYDLTLEGTCASLAHLVPTAYKQTFSPLTLATLTLDLSRPFPFPDRALRLTRRALRRQAIRDVHSSPVVRLNQRHIVTNPLIDLTPNLDTSGSGSRSGSRGGRIDRALGRISGISRRVFRLSSSGSSSRASGTADTIQTSSISKASPGSTPGKGDLPETTSSIETTLEISITEGFSNSTGSTFRRSADVEQDIARLQLGYVLQENEELKALVEGLIELSEIVRSSKVAEISELEETFQASARFTLHLAVLLNADREESRAVGVVAAKAFSKVMITGGSFECLTIQEAKERLTTQVSEDDKEEVKKEVKKALGDGMKELEISHPELLNAAHQGDPNHPNKPPSTSLSRIFHPLLASSITVLDTLKDVSQVTPEPALKPVFGSVVVLLKAVEQTRANAEEIRQICRMAGSFAVSLAPVCMDKSLVNAKLSPRFYRCLEIFERCFELSKKNVALRFLQNSADKGEIDSLRLELEHSIQKFQIENQVLMQFDLKAFSDTIHEKLDQDAVTALPTPPTHVGLTDDYLEHSRTPTLQSILQWLDSTASPSLVLWLHGGPGLGKSTLTHKLVDTLRGGGRLASFAFFTRGKNRDVITTIRMMGRELAGMHPRAYACVAKAARGCSSGHGSVLEYLQAYILDPVRELNLPYSLLVVLDALDEWEHCEALLKQLENLSSSPSPSTSSSSSPNARPSPTHHPVKFLLTSRRTQTITRALRNVPAHTLELPPLSQTVMQVYFEKRFQEIDWDGRNPPSSAAERLAELSNGLPVWGATVCAILSSDSFNRPPAYVLLEEILASGSRVSADKRLWTLYHTGLSGLLTPDSNTEEDREILMKVLSHMFVLQESVSVSAFANLVQLPEMTVRRVHERLQALQTRGTFSKDTIEPMSSRFHASFMDFLTAPSTPSPPLASPYSVSNSNSSATSFRLDVAEAHRRAAERCLALVIQVGTSDSSLSATGTPLPRRGLHRYAIKYWPYHVANGTDRFQPLPETLEALLEKFTPAVAEWWMEKLVQEKVVAQSVDYVESEGEDGDGDGEDESEEGEPDDAVEDDAQAVVDRLAEVADMANDEYSIGDPGWWWWNVHCLEVAVRIQVHKPDIDNWVDLGWCYANAHQSTASSKYLDDALAIFRHAVGMKRSWRTLDSLGQTLSSIFEDRNDMNALEESISLHRESLADTSSLKHSEHATSLVNVGTALQWRFDRLGRSEDLDSAIQLYRQSLTLVADDDPEKPISIINLGNALCARFVRQSIVEDLDEAIRLLRYGLEICQSDEGGDTKPRLLTNLVQILRFSYYKRGNIGDLEEAIRINREALTLDRGQGRRHSLICLVGCLTAWFERSGDLQDIDEAIRISREALAMCPGKHSERYGALLDLGSSLKARFLSQGGTEELEEAVLVNREALELCAGNHSFRYLALTNLSITLRLRFDLLGDGDDLDEAISLASEALCLCPHPHSGRSSALVALAEAFQTRFIQEVSEEDIEQAIKLGHEALELRLGADPERWEALTSLAKALEMRFIHQNDEGEDDDREEAISLNREAAALCPPPHPGRWRTLTNLASSLLQGRDEEGLLLERVEESVNLNLEALSLCHRHHPYRRLVLANLGRALRRRFQLTQSSEDIGAAIPYSMADCKLG
ncbi:hypothetical protein CC1G_13817 [Coprinopsis cinerea okayama7|uniref:Nephrocystin 3-like N-terminal domain-containing protein n=1 Tax=Coprinopsis cinerea (strain Okayama-7 / 130 / ATCC MYA-4618 / FGSC 9003) TaxID=240176 RepID=D6RKE2_COPC7|nr:hypothetical protein CC1G_13817 [Coprinopsis cinerea okayama7\|eukprot:XP_002911782.1 hypothetical protein CC1G_13817 [Coprinopsis cinerea okayama7\